MNEDKVSSTKQPLSLPPLAYGAWAFGGAMWGGADKQEALEAIKFCYDSGITAFDTAPVYGFGRSEEILAEALQGIPRDTYQVFTKFGLRWDQKTGSYYFSTEDHNNDQVNIYKYSGRESVIWECEQSLRRLRTDVIDLYQIHWSDPNTPISETMEGVLRLLEQGKIRAAGVCNYGTTEVDEALKYIDLLSNQVPYSLVNRGIESGVIPQAKEKKLKILAYSPLQRGLLTGKIKPDHRFTKGDTRKTNPFFKPENINRINQILDEIKPIADEHNATLAQVIIHWTMNRSGIDCVLVGARNERQSKDNIKALQIRLTPEELDRIDKAGRDFEPV